MEIVLLLFSALLTTIVALECEFCSSSTGNTCSGHYEICQSSDSRCRVTLTETTLGNIRSAVLEKSCGSVYNCTHPPSLTTNGYQVRVSTVCCDTDHCNIGTVNLSPVNDTLNGESCPSCFARDSDQCEMQTVVNCTGEEHKCVYFTVSRYRGSTITMAGCASESVTASQGKAAFRGLMVEMANYNEHNGAGSLRPGPVIMSLVIITAIFT